MSEEKKVGGLDADALAKMAQHQESKILVCLNCKIFVFSLFSLH